MQCTAVQCTLPLSVLSQLIEGEVKQSFVSLQSVMISSLLSLLLSATLLTGTAGAATSRRQSQSGPPGLGHDLNTVTKEIFLKYSEYLFL